MLARKCGHFLSFFCSTCFPLEQEEQRILSPQAEDEQFESCIPLFGTMREMLNLVESISAWNNQGVFMTMDGNFQGSVNAFSHALVSLKRLFRGTRANVNNSSFWRSWHLEAVQVTAPEPPITSSGNWILASNFFMIAPIHTRHDSSITEPQLDALTAVLMYNSALSMQMSCLVSSQGRSKKFIKAKQLYMFAAGLARELGSAEKELFILWLSVSNNMAALALEMGDSDTFETSREWMGMLLATGFGTTNYNTNHVAENFAATSAVRDWPAPAA